MKSGTLSVLFLSVIFSSCSMHHSLDVNSKDFIAETHAGIYSVSAKDCDLMMQRQVLHRHSPIKCERLKKVIFPFASFPTGFVSIIASDSDKSSRSMGALIVLDVVAEQVLSLFNTLYQFQFPLNQAIPIEYFSEEEKLKDNINNSYAFDSRLITRGTTWSEHAYGVAIDINPFQNPYLYVGADSRALVIPKSAMSQYLNRARYRPSKVTRFGMAEEVVLEFAKHGFVIWGGDWDSPIDYMHFQVGSRDFINKLISLPFESAKAWFSEYVAQINTCLKTANTMLGLKDQDLARKFCVEKVTTEFK
ncbi:M15 family metallopeptidase [uncultured Shewanella sp.]|uniref:M15 family metallopeptidase n=1 Tax=uncultured Shewanella sp. TaxID=173975 RepID=UPI00260E6B7F|nr:M15 family metallopeptidase [uncultured Shewanella sp.]